MAITEVPIRDCSTPNMRPSCDAVNPDKKRRKSATNPVGLGRMTVFKSAEDLAVEEILAYPGLVELKKAGAAAFMRVAISVKTAGRGTNFTPAQFAKAGSCSRAFAGELIKTLLTAGVLLVVSPHFRGSSKKKGKAAKYAIKMAFFHGTHFHSVAHQGVTEYLSVQPRTKVSTPPKVQKRRSAPTVCLGEGTKVSHGKKINPEVEAMALRIEALAGSIAIEPEMLRGMLRKHTTTMLDIDQAIADVQTVLPVRQRTKHDTDGRQLVLRYLSMEAVRLGVADQAAKIRAKVMRETAAATTGIPIVDAAERLAATFRIRAKNFPSKILPEVLADPVRTEMLVQEGRERNRNSTRPMESSEAFAYRAMTMPSEWAKVKDSQKVDARIAERSQALQKVVREGYLRCGISDIPSSHVVRLLQDWAVLDVSHDHKRIAASALLSAAEESLGTDADHMKQDLTERLCSEGETMGPLVRNNLWMSRWYHRVASAVSWLPLESQERLEKKREAEYQSRAARNRGLETLWDLRATEADTLPEGERQCVKLCLAMREVLGQKDYLWTDIISPVVYLGIYKNSIRLGVEKSMWSTALILEDSLPTYLPEAQEISGVAMSILFETSDEAPYVMRFASPAAA